MKLTALISFNLPGLAVEPGDALLVSPAQGAALISSGQAKPWAPSEGPPAKPKKASGKRPGRPRKTAATKKA